MNSNEELLTVAELAARLRVQPSWVYTHADRIGVIRVGKYLRFNWVRALARVQELTVRLGPPPNNPEREGR